MVTVAVAKYYAQLSAVWPSSGALWTADGEKRRPITSLWLKQEGEKVSVLAIMAAPLAAYSCVTLPTNLRPAPAHRVLWRLPAASGLPDCGLVCTPLATTPSPRHASHPPPPPPGPLPPPVASVPEGGGAEEREREAPA